MRRFFRNNGLSLVLFGLFVVSIGGQAVFGWRAEIEELQTHALPSPAFTAYLASGHFISAVFENWESEFLQMGAYILLTAFLVQKGSPESKKPDAENPEDADPREARDAPDAPAPVRWGGLALRLYSHSLSIAMAVLFVLSFWLHAAGTTQRLNEETAWKGGTMKTITDVLQDPEFWFESFQNWQSEFLSIGVLVVFSIYLRQRGSPESKPVASPHDTTGH